jgi:phage tail sheath protein FI
MPVRHGIFINEPVDAARAIVDVATAVIGLPFVAADADPDLFPLNKPVLIGDVRAALGSVGDEGTGGTALEAIHDQVSPIIVAVRCETTANPEDQDEAIIGTIAGGAYTGIQALLAAEAIVGVRPRILGAPGLDSAAVFGELGIIAQRLNAMAYGYCSGATSVSEALVYAEDFALREQMLIWPGTSAPNAAADIIARALGMRAQIDETIGWHKTLSNVVVNGITGIEVPVFFDYQDPSTDAGLLNDGPITTLVRKDGYRFWGNRTRSAEPLFAFESAVRTAQVLRDSIAAAVFPFLDKPLTEGLAKVIIDMINADFALKVAQGRLIGGRAWFDPAQNPQQNLAAGKLAIDWDFTPCAPMEDFTGNQRITDRYYAGFGRNLG